MFLVVYGRFDASFFSHTEKKDVGIEKRKSGGKRKKRATFTVVRAITMHALKCIHVWLRCERNTFIQRTEKKE
jgi:hypothetical protein